MKTLPVDEITLSGSSLAFIDSPFGGIRPEFKKQVTIVFTDGKSDARWAGAPQTAFGRTLVGSVHISEREGRCSAICLVDLYALLTRSKTPEQTVGRSTIPPALSPRLFRYLVVETIVHELAHVAQGWQLGESFARDLQEEQISATARAKEYADKNPEMPDSAERQNQFERGARDFADRWMNQHADDVHAGNFDFLLPIIVLRGEFRDLPAMPR